MPHKPLWLCCLANRPDDWVDHPALESLLGIGRRRALQLLAPLAQRRVGTSLVAHRADLIVHRQKESAAREEAYYEVRRQLQFWTHLSQARQEY
jgi:hypothetical protein